MSDILDLIDNAISDHYTSADAMRWTPDPVVATGGIRSDPGLRVVYHPVLFGVTINQFREVIEAISMTGSGT